MLSSNLALRTAYLSALNNITYDGSPVPVYWEQLPTTIAPGVYIVYGKINNQDQSNKGGACTLTSVTVTVYTNALKYNDGVAVETVANEVLNRIYKTPQFNISLAGTFYQVTNTTLASDTPNSFSVQNQFIYMDRILVFNHLIYQNVS